MSPPLTQHRLRTLWYTILSAAMALLPLGSAFAQSNMMQCGTTSCMNPIKLLEPLPDGTTCLCPSATTFGMVNAYLKPMLTWMVGIATGLAVLMVIIGGIQIIMSNGDPGKIGEGKKRVTEAILGLLMLVLSGAILYLLNADFFRLSS